MTDLGDDVRDANVGLARLDRLIVDAKNSLLVVAHGFLLAACVLRTAACLSAAPRVRCGVMCAGGAETPLPNVRVRAPRKIRGTGARGAAPPAGRGVDRSGRSQGKSEQERELQRLYITGGEYRGRRIATPDIFLRPMMSRVREALFSILVPTGVIRSSAAALDLFSGAGTIGLECVSRGMGHATLVDFSPVCTRTIRENCEKLGATGSTRVIEGSVFDVLRAPERFGLNTPFELVTVTPPYEEVVYSELVEALASSPLVGEDTLIVIEYPVELGCFPPVLCDGKLVGLRNRKYGRTVLALYVSRPSGRIDYPPFSEEFVSLKTGKSRKISKNSR
ncbi:hypothetical protein AB1Y20_006243 [Prymnesium parvum]|uniref:Uncharacterized protein n=1 Tax=Prymnesium parvum TaxID=97485 RepID=A0AB34J253_PRYPA